MHNFAFNRKLQHSKPILHTRPISDNVFFAAIAFASAIFTGTSTRPLQLALAVLALVLK
jgi:hypothetical protein